MKSFFSCGTSPLLSVQPTVRTYPKEHLEKRRFRPKSTFMPPVSNPSVQTFCRLVDQDVFHLFTRDRHFFPTLSIREREALGALSEDVSIVIKPADKGGAVVIQDKDSYRNEILYQLGDQKFYSSLTCDPTSRFFNMIKKNFDWWRIRQLHH